jgi:hypothetical protein
VYELEPLSDTDSKRLLYSLFEAEHLEGIGNLRFLKALDLSTVYIDELPASILHLRQLEHLLVQTDVKLPDGIGKLRHLRWHDGGLRRGGGDRGVGEEADEEDKERSPWFCMGAGGGEARVPCVPAEPLAMSDEEDRERGSD